MKRKLTLTGMLLNFLSKPTIYLSRPLKTRTGIIIRDNCLMTINLDSAAAGGAAGGLINVRRMNF